jgi:hypothetical protein
MSLTEVMVESLHHVIDQLTGILLTLLGEVEIEHGGFEFLHAKAERLANHWVETDAAKTTRPPLTQNVTQREGQSVSQGYCIKNCLACVCRGSCSTLPSHLKPCSAGTRERAGGVQMYR